MNILASFGLWLVRRFSTVRPGEVLVGARPNLMLTTDATAWSKEFVAYQISNPAIAFDEATMISWFASAISVGSRDHVASTSKETQPVPMTIDDWLNTWDADERDWDTTGVLFNKSKGEIIRCSLKGRKASVQVSAIGSSNNSTGAFVSAVREAERIVGAKWRKDLPFSPDPLLVERSNPESQTQAE